MSYLIVSAIQMGATIDYAIVITNRYLQLKTVLDRRAAAVEALNQSFPTVLTSGSIMTVAGFLIGKLSTDTIISSIGDTLGRGTLTSIVLVMTVLPQLLVLGDALIERTAITLNRDRKQRFQNGTMRLDGHVRGHVSGFIDGEFKGRAPRQRGCPSLRASGRNWMKRRNNAMMNYAKRGAALLLALVFCLGLLPPPARRGYHHHS